MPSGGGSRLQPTRCSAAFHHRHPSTWRTQLKDLIEQSEVRLTEVRAEEAHLIATLAEARQEKERNGVWLKEARGALKHMAEDQAKSQRGFAFGQR